jgi:RNA polymerase sigma-70 factor (ECF subfamily)
MSEVSELTPWTPTARPGRHLRSEPISNDDWIDQLSATGPRHDAAVARLHDLMLRSAWHQVNRMPESATLGSRRREEVVHAAADEATMSVLARLDAFEGRSRFTTWAYKFGILHAGVEVRRSAWRDREIDLDSVPEPSAPGTGPEGYLEARDLSDALSRAMATALTPHQRRVALALLIEHVPIDVLAERLGTTRNALYKTLHDARKALRSQLVDQGLLSASPTKEVTR